MGYRPDLDRRTFTADWAAARGPADELAVIHAIWTANGMTAGTRRRFGELAERFAARLQALGVASLTAASVEDCESFVWTRTRRNENPSMHTVHLRRSVLRSVYAIVEQLDPTVIDPTRRIELPAKTARLPRALTDNEIDLLRTTALGRRRQPLRAGAVVALAEAAATTTEIAQTRWCHIDLDTGTVDLCGADPIRPRTTRLTDWAAGLLTTWRHHLTPADGDHVVNRRRPDMDPHVAQAAITNQLALLLHDAGLRDPQIKPDSVRLWAARTVLERDGIEAAARTLGVSSLDTAAAILEHRWQQP